MSKLLRLLFGSPGDCSPVIKTDGLECLPTHLAVLCEGCGRLSQSPGDHCVLCGSKAIVGLSGLLARRASPGLPEPTGIERQALAEQVIR